MQVGSYYIPIEQIARGAAFVLMAVGLVVIPILPGLFIIWAAALGYGLASGFDLQGGILFGVISLLFLAGSVADNVLMGAKAHKEGAPWWVILLALLAAIIGSIAIPVPLVGGILSALTVLFLVEWLRLKDTGKALKSMQGMVVGWGWAMVFRVIIGMTMIGLWLIWAWI
jgi:uncharacterized protein YqgC (DUF456 family)